MGGDLRFGPGATLGSLSLNGRTKQTVSGGQINVTDVTLDNSSRAGVVLECDISYSGSCTTGDTRVVNGDRLIAKQP